MTEPFYLDRSFQDVFNKLEDGIFIADDSGYALWVNETSVKQIGSPLEEIIGKHVTELESREMFTPSVTNLVLDKREAVSSIQTSQNRKLLASGYLVPMEAQRDYVLVHVKDITDMVRSSLQLEKAESVINFYVEELKKTKEDHKLTETEDSELIGKSKKFMEMKQLIKTTAQVDATLLIQGETGVGKSVIAKNIHETSERKDRPFIPLNCSAIPAALLESELFGYKKGAFTGANAKGKKGIVQEAEGGTLFLDEIGDLPLELQPKLLQLMQEKLYIPVGSSSVETTDIRIITATNSDLSAMVAEGRFREDLYYRLNVISVEVPSLRERFEDIPLFVHHYMEIYNKKYNRSCILSNEAMECFQNYEWPGNIRELENVIERAVITSSTDLIVAEELPDKLKIYEEKSPSRYVPDMEKQSLPSYLEDVEKQAIIKAFQKNGSSRKAADALGITQSAFMRRVKKYNLALQKSLSNSDSVH
ncbi:PAS domain S-box protein [Marinococcus halophilus]|uniref:HTH-type transcriptional regulatory protein TyrR n=1 Tax=Marinococcus halophilus TaxID=1371 RepID=A0A510YBA9_MARHA|nr:sigma 54-interacting transcriptional regulator [Marinococcus halophilus]OZT79085.1 PAS domain S-box protein [Marinococcus halophilus]GEK59931.1 RNA polymerase subunit sigma-54 [Marinococcus halophilus]